MTVCNFSQSDGCKLHLVQPRVQKPRSAQRYNTAERPDRTIRRDRGGTDFFFILTSFLALKTLKWENPNGIFFRRGTERGGSRGQEMWTIFPSGRARLLMMNGWNFGGGISFSDFRHVFDEALTGSSLPSAERSHYGGIWHFKPLISAIRREAQSEGPSCARPSAGLL